ncbi:MAG: hypothetical protein R2715_11305 [Ilumatobacteraceae bacterium]
MIAVMGDLILDVIVLGADHIRHATDTTCRIEHRRGGSAANVAAPAARTPRGSSGRAGPTRSARGCERP